MKPPEDAYRTSQHVSDTVHRIVAVRGLRWIPWPLSVDMSVGDVLHLQQSPRTMHNPSPLATPRARALCPSWLQRVSPRVRSASSAHTALHGLRRVSSIGCSHTGISFSDRAEALLLLPLFDFLGTPHCAGTVLLMHMPRRWRGSFSNRVGGPFELQLPSIPGFPDRLNRQRFLHSLVLGIRMREPGTNRQRVGTYRVRCNGFDRCAMTVRPCTSGTQATNPEGHRAL